MSVIILHVSVRHEEVTMIREHERVPVDFYVNKVIDGVPHLAKARDISMGGVYLQRLIEPKTPSVARTSIEFVLPGTTEVLWAETEIAHGDDRSGHGFMFRNLTPRTARILNNFLQNRQAAMTDEMDSNHI